MTAGAGFHRPWSTCFVSPAYNSPTVPGIPAAVTRVRAYSNDDVREYGSAQEDPMKRAPLIVIIVLSVLVVGLGTLLAIQLIVKPSDGQNPAEPDVTPQAEPTPVTTPTPTGDFTSEGGTTITIDDWSGAPVTSPFTFSGEVPGTWASGGSFSVLLTDLNGNVLDQANAPLEGDWMTEDPVPFTVTLSFDQPGDSRGFLVLVKENPSGLPEKDDSLSIPVTFP